MAAILNMDSTLSSQSFISPTKNKSSIDTQASLHYSDLTQQSNLLKLQSINNEKSINFQLLPIETCRQLPFHQEQTSKQNNQNRIKQLLLLQKLVSEAFTQYANNKIQINMNQQKIDSLQRDNKYRKIELIHLKDMAEHLRKRQRRVKKRLRIKTQEKQKQTLNQINLSKQRASHYFEQIKKLKQQIYEQKKVRKELQWNKKLRSQQQSRIVRHYTFNSNYNPANPSAFSFYQNQYSANSMNSFGNIRTSSKQSNPQTKRSFDPLATPNFVTKKNSLQDQFSPQNFNVNMLMDALAANFNNVTFQKNHSNSNLQRQNSNPSNSQQLSQDIKLIKSSGKKGNWQNSHEQIDVLNLMEDTNKKSGYKRVQTPNFDQKFSKKQQINFTKFHQIRSAEISEDSMQRQRKNSHQNYSKQSPKKIPNRNSLSINSSQSNIRIQVEESVTSMSKHQLQRMRKLADARKAASLQRKIVQQWENTAQNQQDEVVRCKSPTLPQKKVSANSSFQKIQLDEAYSSQIILKPLAPPPNLLKNKNGKLRKVTEQQSDLFDSDGYPKMHNRKHERQKSNTISVKDVILDQQNLKQSQAIYKGNNSIYSSIPSMKQQTLVRLQAENNKNHISQEDNDDDDFLKINLAAVSKISKEKQFSQKPVITQHQNFEEQDEFPIYKSQNIVSKIKTNKTQPIKQQANITSAIKNKRENQLQKARKVSGSRFSEIVQHV